MLALPDRAGPRVIEENCKYVSSIPRLPHAADRIIGTLMV
jgi:hypothetical protein